VRTTGSAGNHVPPFALVELIGKKVQTACEIGILAQVAYIEHSIVMHEDAVDVVLLNDDGLAVDFA
jgi:hypothetical protein